MPRDHPPKAAVKNILIVRIIRSVLTLSILLYIALIVFQLLTDGLSGGKTFVATASQYAEYIFWALLTLILSFFPDYLERHSRIHFPIIINTAIVVFIFAGIYLSARFNLYYRFFWWDDLLHTMSGVIIGFIGFIITYLLNKRYSLDMNPLFVAIFAFSFAVTLGVMWEFFEFGMDMFFGTANQKWDLPADAVLLGKPYQGSGLRDTMSDLIVDSIGALITSTICYGLYKNEKKKTLETLQQMLPEEKKGK